MIPNGAIAPNDPDRHADVLAAQADAYSVLMSAIAKASSDPARLRQIVYAMALQNLKSDLAAHGPISDPVEDATNLLELEEALRLEHAIARIERDTAAGYAVPEPRPDEGDHEGPREQSLAPPAERPTAAVSAEPIPSFLDPIERLAPGTPPYGPAFAQPAFRPGLISAAHLVAASVFGVAFYVGMAGWIRMEQQPVAQSALASAAPTQHAESASRSRETVGLGHPEMRHPRTADDAEASFPLPGSHGIYAGQGGRLTALQPLQVPIPTAQFQTSAEITEPSRVLVSRDDIKFVVFRPDISAETPQSAVIRVVARVVRSTTFVDGQSRVTPMAAATWRVRDKSYEFKVTPLDGHPDMLMVEPEHGLVLSPGRYALMLNGEGYDFAVPGVVTAPEQCLEQFQMQNGMMLSECPNS